MDRGATLIRGDKAERRSTRCGYKRKQKLWEVDDKSEETYSLKKGNQL